MKISFDVDCTPEEARRFLGLPDVAGMQEAVMEELQRKMLSGLETMDSEQMLKTWMSPGLKGFEELQRAFWGRMARGPGKSQGSDED